MSKQRPGVPAFGPFRGPGPGVPSLGTSGTAGASGASGASTPPASPAPSAPEWFDGALQVRLTDVEQADLQAHVEVHTLTLQGRTWTADDLRHTYQSLAAHGLGDLFLGEMDKLLAPFYGEGASTTRRTLSRAPSSSSVARAASECAARCTF